MPGVFSLQRHRFRNTPESYVAHSFWIGIDWVYTVPSVFFCTENGLSPQWWLFLTPLMCFQEWFQSNCRQVCQHIVGVPGVPNILWVAQKQSARLSFWRQDPKRAPGDYEGTPFRARRNDSWCLAWWLWRWFSVLLKAVGTSNLCCRFVWITV